MSFRGVTFGGENVTPANDGGLYAAHHGDGILLGCSMSLSGTDLIISSGEFIACGRVIQVDGSTSVDLSGVSISDGYVQVIMNLEPNNSPMYYTSWVESASTTFPSLTQQDLNLSGTQYQIELAVVQMVGGSPSSIYSTMDYSYLIADGDAKTRRLYISDDRYGSGDIPTIFLGTSNDESLAMWYASPNSNYTRVGNYAGGSWNSGVDLYDNGDAFIFGSGGNVALRPNGPSITTGQMYITSSGQQIGGHPFVVNKQASPGTTLSNATIYNITNVTGLDSSGIYMVTGIVGLGINSSNTRIELGIDSSSATLGNIQTHYSVLAAGFYASYSMLLTGYSTMYFCIKLTNGSGTLSNYDLKIIRIS